MKPWQKSLLSGLAMFACWFMGYGVGMGLPSKGSDNLPFAAACAALGVVFAYAAVLAFPTNPMARWRDCFVGFMALLVLSCVATPVFKSARLASTYARCIGNAKQIATATQIYVTDYDDRYPDVKKWSAIEAYDHNLRYKCPDAEQPYSYAMNAALSAQKAEDVEDPANTILIFETDSPTPFPFGTLTNFVPRHYGSGTVAYADCHARKIKKDDPQAIWTPQTEKPKK